MKTLIALSLLIACAAQAQVHVQGYTRSNGTYVQPYTRTAPDNTNLNNYSTQGNVNPYTGQAGTVQPNYAPSYQAPVYQQPVYVAPIQQCGYTASGQYICQ